MPRKSRAILSDKELVDIKKQISSLLGNLDATDSEMFLEELLTEEEKIMLGKRISLYTLLYQGASVSDAQQTLGISYETARTYNIIKDHKSGFFKKAFSKEIEKRNIKKTVAKIEEKLKPLEYALNAKTNMKARAKLLP